MKKFECPNCIIHNETFNEIKREIPLSVANCLLTIHDIKVSSPVFGYKCPYCKQEFTTTESDTYSLLLAKHLANQLAENLVNIDKYTEELSLAHSESGYPKTFAEIFKQGMIAALQLTNENLITTEEETDAQQ